MSVDLGEAQGAFVAIFNVVQNICRLFQLFTQFPFFMSETKLHYYHQKLIYL